VTDNVIHVVGLSGGKDSTTSAIVALETHPRDRLRFVKAETDNEHEVTDDYIHNYLPQALGITVESVRADFSDEFATKRAKLERIAGGELESDVYGNRGFKYRWTVDAAKRALELLHPTGNAFVDLCLVRGGFPSRKRQFCTEYLKVIPMTEFQLGLIDQGNAVWSWQGTRIHESDARMQRLRGTGACVKSFEVVGGGLFINRPILRWHVEDVFDAHRAAGVRPNPLYTQGMSRVGCMPCINERKDSLHQIAKRFPHHIEKIAGIERLVSQVCRPGSPVSFFQMGAVGHTGQDTRVWEVVEWAKTTRGGKQYSLLNDVDEPSVCSSAYGLCE
jgi:3'-phosphoadenosine 5'-phosphosulfate sulfotransferase (PAPS reductase)/FAD synthetase